MKTLVIGMPDSLPAELADNPDVLVIDPTTLASEVLAALNEASGGMALDDGEMMPGGEGALESWAKEEEKEHGMGGYGDDDKDGMGDDEDGKGYDDKDGMGDDDKDGMGDDEDGKGDDDKDGMGDDEDGKGYDDKDGMGDDDKDGMGDDEPGAKGYGKGYAAKGYGKGKGLMGGKGGFPALVTWARSMGRAGR